MQNVNLDARLAAAAEMVEGDYIADVGTDHGFLPVFLCEKNSNMRAVASDIKKAPLERAVKNVAAHSLENRGIRISTRVRWWNPLRPGALMKAVSMAIPVWCRPTTATTLCSSWSPGKSGSPQSAMRSSMSAV